MNTNESCKELFLKMKEDLGELQAQSSNRLLNIKKSYHVVSSYCRKVVPSRSFESEKLEIEFYKQIRPSFEAEIFFLEEMYSILSILPVDKKEKKKFLKSQFSKIQYFRNRYSFLYEYYCLQRVDLDSEFFLKKEKIKADSLGLILPLCDECSTSAGRIFAYFKTYDELFSFLQKEISGVVDRTKGEEGRFKWTDSKSALIELVYALHSRGAVNHGKSDVKMIISILESLFNVRVGNFYRTFQSMRIRKKNRTIFLDSLKDSLEKRMDETDMGY